MPGIFSPSRPGMAPLAPSPLARQPNARMAHFLRGRCAPSEMVTSECVQAQSRGLRRACCLPCAEAAASRNAETLQGGAVEAEGRSRQADVALQESAAGRHAGCQKKAAAHKGGTEGTTSTLPSAFSLPSPSLLHETHHHPRSRRGCGSALAALEIRARSERDPPDAPNMPEREPLTTAQRGMLKPRLCDCRRRQRRRVLTCLTSMARS